jgi:hypothetical protein
VAKSGISQINGFPAISVHSSSVREQDNIETRFKDDPVQGIVTPSVVEHIDRVLARVRCFGKAQGGEIRDFTNQWIPGNFVQLALGSQGRQDRNPFQRLSSPRYCFVLGCRALEQ